MTTLKTEGKIGGIMVFRKGPSNMGLLIVDFTSPTHKCHLNSVAAWESLQIKTFYLLVSEN